MACTSIPRTLLDLAYTLGPETLDDALSRALVSRRTSIVRLDRYLAAPFAGRRGAAALRLSIDAHRDRTGLTQSLLEVLVDRAVMRGKLPPPVRQLSVRVEGERFLLDLAWPDGKVFVEADGRAFHSTRAQFSRDRHRQNLLVTMGWLPLRYTWSVAKHDPTRVIDQLQTVLDLRRGTR
jgi:very-short-patch-repair endonuclease